MKENIERVGATAIMVEELRVSSCPNKVKLTKHTDAKFLAFVHAETSTGVLSDAKTLCKIARSWTLNDDDAVTSFAGTELRIDD